MLSEENWSQEQFLAYAASLKEAGNAAFGRRDFDAALEQYSNGLDALDRAAAAAVAAQLQQPEVPSAAAAAAGPEGVIAVAGVHGRSEAAIDLLTTLLSNRAQASLTLGRHAEAAADCDEALQWRPSHAKALFRLGVASAALGDGPRYDAAIGALRRFGHEAQAVELAQRTAGMRLMTREELDASCACVIVGAGRFPPVALPSVRLPKDDARLLVPARASSDGAENEDAASSPILCALVGLPFALRRWAPTVANSPNAAAAVGGGGGGNEFAAALMMAVGPRASSSATPTNPWCTDSVGSVLVFRTDGRDVTEQHVWALWDYVSEVRELVRALQVATERDKEKTAERTQKLQLLLSRKGFDLHMSANMFNARLPW